MRASVQLTIAGLLSSGFAGGRGSTGGGGGGGGSASGALANAAQSVGKPPAATRVQPPRAGRNATKQKKPRTTQSGRRADIVAELSSRTAVTIANRVSHEDRFDAAAKRRTIRKPTPPNTTTRGWPCIRTSAHPKKRQVTGGEFHLPQSPYAHPRRPPRPVAPCRRPGPGPRTWIRPAPSAPRRST